MGARVLYRKEIAEFLRTWRIAVLGGFVLFFALTSPILAKLTPQILQYVSASSPGVVIKIPPPTYVDAYAQWIKNLSQMCTFVILIVAAGSVAGEVSQGTAALVLTKPVSRAWFVVVKATTLAAFVVALTVLGTLVVQLETIAVFGSAPPIALWGATLSWLLFALMVVSLVTLLSAVTSTLVAAGTGIVGFFVLSAIEALLRPPLPVLVLVSEAFVALGAVAFARREI